MWARPKTIALAAVIGGPSMACVNQHAASQSPAAFADISREGAGEPLILAAGEGEHRLRRVGGVAGFTIKIDPMTAHSPALVLVTEAIAPNERIPGHIHPSEDEIIFIHAGSGMVELGSRRDSVSAGATVYVPRATRIALRNTGNNALEIVAVFSRPGFEQYLRDTSVPDGQKALPLTGAELASVRQKHAAHVVWEPR